MPGRNDNSENEEKNGIKILTMILKAMCDSGAPTEPKQHQVDEIVSRTGIEEKDVVRSLYVLEGHKYVSPFPKGNFTSRIWQATEAGFQALPGLQKQLV